jgi:hypothetical protein
MGLLMRLFKGLTEPLYDETLTSWLFRCSVAQSTVCFDRRGLQARPEWWLSRDRLHSADPDFDFKAIFARSAAEMLNLDLGVIAEFFSPRSGAMVGWQARHLFCPECLRQDIAQWRLPGWRKAWCSEDSVYCLEHRYELVRLRSTPKYSKAWDAFCQTCNDSTIPSGWEDLQLARYRISCVTRIKAWISSNNSNAGAVSVALFKKLYCLFLQLPFRGTYGGAARVFFQSSATPRPIETSVLKDSIELGPATADTSSRFGSLMFCAMFLVVIPPHRIKKMITLGESMSVNWPFYAKLNRSIFLPSVDRQGFEYLHDYLGKFDRGGWPQLDNFLAAQEERYTREGVFGGVPFGS